MCLFLVYLLSWLGLAHALCSVQAFHILLHVCMSVDFASVKFVIKESYYLLLLLCRHIAGWTQACN